MIKGIIFDLDGTLYNFKGKSNNFNDSRFYFDLKIRVLDFLSKELDIDSNEARNILEIVNTKYNGEISLGLENEYGIDRIYFFESTWNCKPAEYIDKNPNLKQSIEPYKGRAVLLTAAPRIWANAALEYLELEDIFINSIISGESDIRKPNPEIFKVAAKKLKTIPENIVSIGDQNFSDIEPAISLGMKSIYIGSEKTRANFTAKSINGALEILKREYL